MINEQLPAYFHLSTWLIQQSITHTYNTRINGYVIPRIKHKFAENRMRNKLPIILNASPNTILEKVLTHSELGFSIYVKKHLLSQYCEHCYISNCYVCRNI